MSFKAAVDATPALADRYRRGLQAMRKSERGRIQGESQNLTGSVDVDAALEDVHPAEARWDYGIGFRCSHDSERVFWVEVHPASSNHVVEVVAKQRWLVEWLAREAPQLAQMPAEYHWLATGGKICITPESPQARKLAAAGLKGPARVLNLR